MNLTGKQLVELGIITGPIEEENIAQHGVDLNLCGVRRIAGSGFIPAEGKTILSKYEEVEPHKIGLWSSGMIGPEVTREDNEVKNILVWQLEPGVYDITLVQGCNIPNNQKLELIQRSSLLRNGALIVSSLFDAGFKTQNIGTVIHVRVPIQIQVGARVCQAYCTSSNEVQNLYNGQFQNDSQRKDGREEVKSEN